MPKIQNLINNKYGKLFVASRLERRGKNNNFLWQCNCDCGNTTEVTTADLTSGHVTSCGCNRKLELTGRVFGRITVIKRDGVDETGNVKWLCKCDCGQYDFCGDNRRIQATKLIGGRVSCACSRKRPPVGNLTDKYFGLLHVTSMVIENGKTKCVCTCDCGGTKTVIGSRLTSGQIKSCGCLAHSLDVLFSTKRPFAVNFKSKLTQCKKNAESRGHSFELTTEQFLNLCVLPCVYCGRSADSGIIGVDRISSAIGYTPDNSVSCCTICNITKNTLSGSNYVEHCKQVAKTWSDKI